MIQAKICVQRFDSEFGVVRDNTSHPFFPSFLDWGDRGDSRTDSFQFWITIYACHLYSISYEESGMSAECFQEL